MSRSVQVGGNTGDSVTGLPTYFTQLSLYDNNTIRIGNEDASGRLQENKLTAEVKKINGRKLNKKSGKVFLIVRILRARKSSEL